MSKFEEQCESCIFNREITAWGDTFMACWYREDNPGEELYNQDGKCSGFKEAQVEVIVE